MMKRTVIKQNQVYFIIDYRSGSQFLVGQLNELNSDDKKVQNLKQAFNEREENKTTAKLIQIKRDTDQ